MQDANEFLLCCYTANQEAAINTEKKEYKRTKKFRNRKKSEENSDDNRDW
jgi:hypothetical protein